MNKAKCQACQSDAPIFDFTMAFQPIVDIGRSRVWGYEALVRGLEGESALTILSRVTDENRYKFDQACRVKAIEAAGRLFSAPDLKLSINFMPNAVYEPVACIRASLGAAERVGFSRDQIMFEFTEDERMVDPAKVTRIIEAYKRFGFLTAIDDFGGGYAGLGLLAKFTPDLIKIDMDLIRDIDAHRARQVIVGGIVAIAAELGVRVLAEGIESEAEALTLGQLGITLLQGYYFARPMTNALPSVEHLFASGAAAAA